MEFADILEPGMLATATCPFCNSLVPAGAGLARLSCPRCGESFVPSALLTVPTASPPAAERSPVSRHRSTRWNYLALGLVVVLGVGAVVLYIKPGRKTPARSNGAQSSRQVVRPADMPGLGYLPESCDIVMGIQVPAFLEKMGPEAERDPSAALTRLGLPKMVAETIDTASGVGLTNVDQVVIGIGFEKGALPPQLVVVVHTREPYDIDRLARTHEAAALKKDQRTLYAVKAERGFEVFWWSPSDRVLIGTIMTRDYESVPMLPKPSGGKHLRAGLQRLLHEHVADDAVLWLAAASDQWAKHLRIYTILPGTPLERRNDLIPAAERLRTIAIGVPKDADRVAEISLGLQNADVAQKLRDRLKERFAGEPIEVAGDDEKVRLFTEFDPVRVGWILSRLLAAN